MHVVGTDRVSVVNGHAAPRGQRHAVTSDGFVLCQDRPARWRFPALAWAEQADQPETCASCEAATAGTAAMTASGEHVAAPEQQLIAAAAYPSEPTLAAAVDLFGC